MNRKYVLGCLLIATLLPLAAQNGACPSGTNSAWSCLKRPGDGSNTEQEVYWDGNITRTNGTLVMTETNSPSRSVSGSYLSADVPGGTFISCSGSGNPGTYTCSSTYAAGRIMWTSYNQQYGDFQIRAKIGYGWPAIWMLGSNCQASEILGPSSISPCNWDVSGSGEIDIAEGSSVSSGTTSIQHHLHESGKSDPSCTTTGLTDITTNFHIYEVIVTNSSIVWKVDGTQTCSISTTVTDNWFLIFNEAIGGTLGGNPASFSYPNTQTIDWVKVCSSACANGITGAAASNGTFWDDFIDPSVSSTSAGSGKMAISGNAVVH